MSKEEDKESILGLFSTRATQDRPVNQSGILPVKSEGNTSTKSQVPSSRSTMTGRSSTSSSTGGFRQNTNRGELSPLASTVLRESRRELGSDFNLQNNESGGSIDEADIVNAVDRVLTRRSETLDDIERANIIIHLQKDLMGWGVLQPLIDNREVTDIHCYDYKTVVLQRGKVSETTGLHWPNHQAYVSFIDRLLLRLGKSLSTQQHTVDASLPNGIRICAIHESVCGQRGPLLCIRVPRVMQTSLESIISYQVAPPLIVNYMASLTRSGLVTMMVAGETGTGKTTLINALSAFIDICERVVTIEDAAELQLQQPHVISLEKRPANIEGKGEINIRDLVVNSLRMRPDRIVVGE